MTWVWVFLIFCAAVVLWPLLVVIERFENKRYWLPGLVMGLLVCGLALYAELTMP